MVSVSYMVLYFQIWGVVAGLDDPSHRGVTNTERVSSVTNGNKCLSSALLMLHFAPHFSSIYNLFSFFATYFSVFVCCWERTLLCTQLDFMALDTGIDFKVFTLALQA